MAGKSDGAGGTGDECCGTVERSAAARIAAATRDGGEERYARKRGETGRGEERRVVESRETGEKKGPREEERESGELGIGGSRRPGDGGGGGGRERSKRGREGVGCSNERNLHDFACFSAPRRCAHRVSAVCLRFLLAFLATAWPARRPVGSKGGKGRTTIRDEIKREGARRKVLVEGGGGVDSTRKEIIFLGFSRRGGARLSR